MPTIKSAKKRVKTTEKKTKINDRWKEKLKTEIKNYKNVIEKGDFEEAEKQYKTTVKVIDKCVNKNIHHKNKAARLKSRFTKMLNKLKNQEE